MNRSNKQKRVNEMLSLIDLTGLGKRYPPHELSGGQQQRVHLLGFGSTAQTPFNG